MYTFFEGSSRILRNIYNNNNNNSNNNNNNDDDDDDGDEDDDCLWGRHTMTFWSAFYDVLRNVGSRQW
jgi:hypothetical protein